MVLALHYITHYRITACEQNQPLSEGIVLATSGPILIAHSQALPCVKNKTREINVGEGCWVWVPIYFEKQTENTLLCLCFITGLLY